MRDTRDPRNEETKYCKNCGDTLYWDDVVRAWVHWNSGAIDCKRLIKCSECGEYFEEKEIQIRGDIDTCDDCLCPE